MTDCSICGRLASTRAYVEGALLDVCGECVAYGREVRPTQPTQPTATQKQVQPVENYGIVLRRAVEASGGVDAVARKLSVNADYLKQIEAQKRAPDERTARKLEQALRIKLLEEAPAEASAPKPAAKSGAFTLADVALIKQAKK